MLAMHLDPIAEALAAGSRVLLAGAPGTGKSTFAAMLARRVAEAGVIAQCLGCDPGSPAFGVPGAVCAGKWDEDGWRLVDFEPLCTLDAVRFRLPLVQAAARLAQRTAPGAWLLDMPGAVRGVPGSELIVGLAAALSAHLVVLLERGTEGADVGAALEVLGIRVLKLRAHEAAHSPSKRARARGRTALWDAFFGARAVERELHLEDFGLIGMPPPRAAIAAWHGRQVAVLRGQECIAFGEVAAFDGATVQLRLGPSQAGLPEGHVTSAAAARRSAASAASVLVIRDALRAEHGLLVTAQPILRGTGEPRGIRVEAAAAEAESSVGRGGGALGARHAAHPDGHTDLAGNRGEKRPTLQRLEPSVRVGPFHAALANGVFRDPLLVVRLAHRGRTLLFDLGETHVLGARTAHQVSDAFITHAHIDHIAGFLWLLRARIGLPSVCRLYGPPGIAANVSGLVNGVHWDRAGEGAPRFEVIELHPDSRWARGGDPPPKTEETAAEPEHVVRRFAVRAGDPEPRFQGEAPARGGLLLDEPLLRVRAVMLDHLTPVLAFALESAVEINVRKEGLAALNARPGPWLTSLKEKIAAGREDDMLELPDGSRRRVKELAAMLVMLRPGTKLVYATDLADTGENRRRLEALARDADVMFCEATFRIADADRAARTGHLTTRACGEIAAAAGVRRLVPFHFSRRYESDPASVYREIEAFCASTAVPADPSGNTRSASE